MPDNELDKRWLLTDLLLCLYKWGTPKYARWVAHEDRRRQVVKRVPSITG